MRVISHGIVNGVIDDKYGKHGPYHNENVMPAYSLPFEVLKAPENTMSFAVFLEAKDASPFSGGFSWVHWLAANISGNKVEENESQTASDFVQGVNSWISIQGGSQSRELSSFYGGMAPPDAPHTYELHVYALDSLLPLENGFMLHDLFHAMEGHIIDQDTLKGVYRN